jgi:hypothetical protein
VPDESKFVAEYRRRATETRRMADAASTPAEKEDLLEVERRWLRLARSHEAKIRASSQTKRHRKGGGAV